MDSAAPILVRTVRRLQEWARERPFHADVMLAALLFILTAVDVAATEPGYQDAGLPAYVLVAIGALALVWRRRAPITVLVVVSLVMAAYWVGDHSSFLSSLGVPALYSLVVHGADRRRVWIAYVGLCVALVTTAGVTVLNADDGFEWFNGTSMILYLTGTAIVGTLVRNRQRIFVDTQRRADQAEADRLAAAERAVARERLRIAREMHDVVAHGMSVVAVQAAAAREIVETNPAKATEVLGRIENVSRDSLTEMRRMLGVLRNNDESTGSLSPQPTIDDVRTAVAQSVESGVATELVVTGTPRDLPHGIGLAAFRIVQEALTNVRKHAGATARATVSIDHQERHLVVEIHDDGRGAATAISDAGGGNGLIGMRERVEAYDGEFSAGPRPGGGYAVRATLPIRDEDHRPAVLSDSDLTESPT